MSQYYTDFFSDINKLSKGYHAGFPIAIKIKTAPSAATKLSQSFSVNRTVEAKDDSLSSVYTALNKSGLKSTCHNGQLDTKLSIGTEGVNYSLGYTPKSQNSADQALTLKHTSKLEAATSHIDSNESLSYAYTKNGPVKLWLTFGFDWNTYNDTRAVQNTGNFNYEDYYFGWTLNHNILTHKHLELAFNLALRNSKADVHLTYDHLNKSVKTGCYHKRGAKATHYYSIFYDIEKKLKGAFGQPVVLNWASEYKLTDAATVKASI